MSAVDAKLFAQLIRDVVPDGADGWSDVSLGELIAHLRSIPADTVFRVGFDRACSYRGFYDQLAFVAAEEVTAEQMWNVAKEADGEEFYGWKGGEYTMSQATPVWFVDDSGSCGVPFPLRMFRAETWCANWVQPPPPPSIEERIEAEISTIPADDDVQLVDRLAKLFKAMQAESVNS